MRCSQDIAWDHLLAERSAAMQAGQERGPFMRKFHLTTCRHERAHVQP
jgi:hypothetical protein